MFNCTIFENEAKQSSSWVLTSCLWYAEQKSKVDPWHISFVESKKIGQNICSHLKVTESVWISLFWCRKKESKVEEKTLRSLSVYWLIQNSPMPPLWFKHIFSQTLKQIVLRTKKLWTQVFCALLPYIHSPVPLLLSRCPPTLQLFCQPES